MSNIEKQKKLEELKKLENEIINLKRDVDYYKSLQMALKLVLNGSYGAFGSTYFSLYNNNVAGTITAQGQDLIKHMEIINRKYWYELWHTDYSTHKELGITNVRRITEDTPVTIYADTDSVDSNTIIKTTDGDLIICDLYDLCEEMYGMDATTLAGHESVIYKGQVLNWSPEKDLYYANVKRIIRHKVNKPKWKIVTESGKEIIVTNDHSIIIFRDGKMIEITPEGILPSDSVLIVD